jgi:hypothetical protein
VENKKKPLRQEAAFPALPDLFPYQKWRRKQERAQKRV